LSVESRRLTHKNGADSGGCDETPNDHHENNLSQALGGNVVESKKENSESRDRDEASEEEDLPFATTLRP
jgi:hypothetical protein